MNKLKFSILVAMVLAAGAALWGLQHKFQVKLSGENSALQRQIDQLTPLAAENQRLSNQVALAQLSPASSNNQSAELRRLRAETEAQKLEIQKLRSQMAAAAAPPPSGELPFSMRFVNIPKESWAFAGYDSPEAALQSMLWATRQGDVNAIRESLTPAELDRRLAGDWKDKTDGEIADAGLQRLSKATGFQILKFEMLGDDTTHFTVYIHGFDPPDQPVWMDMKQIGGGWKSDAAEYHRPSP
ncbi:MAG: hypothetical protein ABSG04_16220 [Verrucomicrobiota bacterium]